MKVSDSRGRIVMMLLSLFFYHTGLTHAEPRLNSYTIFKVSQLAKGKNVTVGKYVLAYVDPSQSITIRAANPPQRLDIKLQWLDDARREAQRPLNIRGEWLKQEQMLKLGIRSSNPGQKPKKYLISRDANGPILLKGQRPDLISLPMKGEQPIHLTSEMDAFGKLGKKVRIVVSSNKAFEIAR